MIVWIMVLLTEFTDIFPGRAWLTMHGTNVYIFGPLVDKAITMISIKNNLYYF